VKPARENAHSANVGGGGQQIEHPLTSGEQQAILAAVARARELQAKLLRARGGKLFGSAADDIARAREERTAARS
jgi:hypothetical protein